MKKVPVDILIFRSYSCTKDPRVSRLLWRLSENQVSVGIVCVSDDCLGHASEILSSHIRIPATKPSKMKGRLGWISFELRQSIHFILQGLTNVPDLGYWGCDLDGFFPAYITAKLRNRKSVFDLFDRWATISGSQTNKRIAFLEKWLLNHASFSLSINSQYLREAGLSVKKTSFTIDNAIPLSLLEILKERAISNVALRSHGIKLNLLYSGRVDKLRAVETSAMAVARNQKWDLIIQGPGEPISSVFDQILSIQQIGALTYFDAVANLNGASLMLATYDPNVPHFRVIDPNKLWEALAFNIPLITSKGCGIEELVLQNDLGYVVKFGDLSELESVLENFSNRQVQQRLKESVKNYYLANSREFENIQNLKTIISLIRK